MSHPKIFSKRDWENFKKGIKNLNLNSWEHLDGLQKVALLKNKHIHFQPYYIFGTFNIVNYIEGTKNMEKIVIQNLDKFKNLVASDKKEIGGIIIYPNSTPQIKILFFGDETRINLDVFDNKFLNTEISDLSLFHTHPPTNLSEEKINNGYNIEHDPPSVLDIVSFILLSVKHITDTIIGSKKFIIKNSIVFTKGEIYVYSLSKELFTNIFNHLNRKYLSNGQNLEKFVYDVEYLLEKIEIFYSALLYQFYQNWIRELHDTSCNSSEACSDALIKKYIDFLASIGIIMKKFKFF